MQANDTISADSRAIIDSALAVALAGAREAAGVIEQSMPGLGKLEWIEKAASDFVTEVDRAAESVILRTIRREFPDSIILGEELSPNADANSDTLTFVVDPLDGTTNFLHSFPHYYLLSLRRQQRKGRKMLMNQ